MLVVAIGKIARVDIILWKEVAHLFLLAVGLGRDGESVCLLPVPLFDATTLRCVLI